MPTRARTAGRVDTALSVLPVSASRARDHGDPVTEVGRPEPLGETEARGDRHDGPRECGGVAAESAEVVADREGLRRRGDLEHLEAVTFEERGKASAGEEMHMRRDDRPPAAAERTRHEAARVRGRG